MVLSEYLAERCLEGFQRLAADARANERIKSMPTPGTIDAAILALNREKSGRKKGPTIGTRDVVIMRLFKEMGIPSGSKDAVSKFLQRHIEIDKSIIWTTPPR